MLPPAYEVRGKVLFSQVSVNISGGGVPHPDLDGGGYPISGLGWGVPRPGLDGGGGYPIPGLGWGVPHPGLDGGGYPILGGTPARS